VTAVGLYEPPTGTRQEHAEVHVTVLSALPGRWLETFWQLYRASFEPLQTRAAARHLMEREEIMAELRDARIRKYVAWRGERPVGLVTLATDLDAVPWVSREYFTSRFPGHAERGVLRYLGYLLVLPTRQREGVSLALLTKVVQDLHAERALLGFDMCDDNFRRGLQHAWERVARGFGDIGVHHLDAQRYMGVSFDGHEGAGPGDAGWGGYGPAM
jgi:hypothetical protein